MSGIHGNVQGDGRIKIGASRTPINNGDHRLDTSVFASKNVLHHSPITKGIEATYTHIPSGSNIGVGATNTPKWGTDIQATGQYNIYQDKSTTASVQGTYGRHFGGISGTQRPNYGVMFQFKKNF